MREFSCLVLMLAFAAGPVASAAEGDVLPDNGRAGVSLAHILERTSERLKKNFIIDPRLRGEVTMYGIDPERITYRELQAVLEVHGFATFDDGEITKVVPDASARQYAMPLIGDRSANVGEDEYVTKAIDVTPLEATQLVPILRPLMPQQAHMVGYAVTNTLIVVDRYSNVKRIEAIVRDLQKRPIRPETSANTAK
jgi:general secretion pathway protein D